MRYTFQEIDPTGSMPSGRIQYIKARKEDKARQLLPHPKFGMRWILVSAKGRAK